MPNKHAVAPVSVRLSVELRAWLLAYAAREGVPANRIIVEALEAVRKCDQEST